MNYTRLPADFNGGMAFMPNVTVPAVGTIQGRLDGVAAFNGIVANAYGHYGLVE
ncbi:MAG: hypothetical protein WA373_06900 [Burkholderiales bacterium]